MLSTAKTQQPFVTKIYVQCSAKMSLTSLSAEHEKSFCRSLQISGMACGSQNYDSDQDPEEYIQPFLDLLDSLKRLCGSDNVATMLVEIQEGTSDYGLTKARRMNR